MVAVVALASLFAFVLFLGLIALGFYLVGISGLISMMIFAALDFLSADHFHLEIGWIIFSVVWGGLLGMSFFVKKDIR